MMSEPWGQYEYPNGDKNQAPQLAGVAPDIIQALAAETGMLFEQTLTPYARIWQHLKQGTADLALLIHSEDRNAYLHDAGYLFPLSSVAFVRKGITLTDYDDLLPLHIGVVRGIHLSPKFDNDTRLHKTEALDYETLAMMFEAGRIDAIVGNNVSTLYILRKMDRETLLGKPFILPHSLEVHALMSKKFSDHSRIEKIRQAVEKLRIDGTINRIVTHWIGPNWTLEKTP